MSSAAAMTPDRWARVKEIFTAALDLRPAARSAYVAQACARDAALRSEVESLLRAHEAAGEFMESGVAPVARPPFTPGQVLAGRYRVVRFIAQGGIGEVYEATDLELGEGVALKTLRPEFARDEPSVERFKREVQLARRVTHPNACRIFGWVLHRSESGETVPLLTMELLQGETLSQRLSRVGALAARDALVIADQMAGALAAVHQAGLVHRDLKSANVMLVPSTYVAGGERTVVTDFGLAQGAAAGESGEGIAGTLDYMAPEQLRGGEILPATDVYSFGIVLFEMLTGKRPFVADTPQGAIAVRVEEAPPSPRERVPDIDPRWSALVVRCLDPDPAERFVDATELVRALRDLRRRGRAAPQWVFGAACLVAGFVLGATGATLVARRGAAVPVSRAALRPGVVVAAFQGPPGERDGLGAVLADLMRADLEARRTAASADVMVVGAYTIDGTAPDRLSLTARAIDARTGATLASASEESTRSDVGPAVNRLALSLERALSRR